MDGDQPSAPLMDGVGLLERAIGYTLGSLQMVTPAAYSRPSPCKGWDLRDLLRHMDDSWQAIHEAADLSRVGLPASTDYGDPVSDPVATLRNRACSMLGAWTNANDRHLVAMGGRRLTAGVVVTTGAVEITVHGWDVAQSCGHPHAIPSTFAEELLPLAALIVSDADRPARFAAPLPVISTAAPDVRLLAFLGRAQS
ncbi:MAG: TIGR03086 family metal-binding protein [Actinomycetota bacterium]|nr:TIGR03086 family metal-binding protein [Actinomycetota bacterium]